MRYCFWRKEITGSCKSFSEPLASEADDHMKKLDVLESDDHAKQYGFKHGPVKVINQDFKLLTEQQAAEARAKVTENNILKDTKFV